jgi:hypothetical protein
LSREDLDLRTITEPVYEWKDHSRYVEIIPVETGWLVNWGIYEQMGAVKRIHGTRVYRDDAGVRRRLADAIIAFTRNPAEARDALMLLDRRGGLPRHRPAPLKIPL